MLFCWLSKKNCHDGLFALIDPKWLNFEKFSQKCNWKNNNNLFFYYNYTHFELNPEFDLILLKL